MRGATRSVLRKCVWDGISTHTPHAGRDLVKVKSGNGSFISTHTPHAGRDFLFQQVFLQSPISTHTPHAGRDEKSTGDLRGKFNFYSHAPCGARLEQIRIAQDHTHFYSHAPCGARLKSLFTCFRALSFLLTRPMRGATF